MSEEFDKTCPQVAKAKVLRTLIGLGYIPVPHFTFFQMNYKNVCTVQFWKLKCSEIQKLHLCSPSNLEILIAFEY